MAAAQYGDRRFLFATDVSSASGGSTDTGELYVRCITAATPFTAESDTGWNLFPVGGTTNMFVGPAVFKDRLYVFAKGVDDRKVYVSSTDDGTTWQEWKIVPFGGSTFYPPSAAVFDDRLYLVIRDEKLKRWISSTGDGTQWSNWAAPFSPLSQLPDAGEGRAGTGYTGGNVPLVAHDGKLHALTHDNDWNVFVSSSADGSLWSEWTPVGGVGGGVAGISFDGGLLVFSQGWDDHQIYVKGSSDGIKWSDPWDNIGSPPPYHRAATPAVIGGGSAITLYVLGKDAIYSRTAIYEVDSQPGY
jgi:hypothetical protein